MLVEQLQKNVNENNDEIAELKKEVKDWRVKYYNELDEKNKLALEVQKLRLELQKFNNQHNSK
jgi:regulator of replication initiation timing